MDFMRRFLGLLAEAAKLAYYLERLVRHLL
jgi:hypothetical protein